MQGFVSIHWKAYLWIGNVVRQNNAEMVLSSNIAPWPFFAISLHLHNLDKHIVTDRIPEALTYIMTIETIITTSLQNICLNLIQSTGYWQARVRYLLCNIESIVYTIYLIFLYSTLVSINL